MDEKPHALSLQALRYLLTEAPHPVGEARARAVLGVDRSTLSRWLSGASKVPQAAALVLRELAEGIPVEGSPRWRGFRFSGDALITPTGDAIPCGVLEKWQWLQDLQAAQVKALQREVARLQGDIEALRRIGGSANDATAREPPAVSGGAS